MRKILSICFAAALLAAVLAGCGKSAEQPSEPAATQSAVPTPTPVPTPPIPFTDVAADAPYYDAVVWAYENGIASDGETFGPADACTRGQAMTFLWRAMGSPEPQMTENPVSDISPSNWFYKPVLWAYESGISTSSSFKPNNPCTNGEALTFLWRAEGRPMAALGSSAIALAAPNQYFTRPVAWAETNGLLSAEVGFNPSANCLRADLMSYFYWAEGQRASAKESRALQEEYEQIINNTWIYDVHGSGLCYADYVDVDNDGKVELLTVGISEDGFEATVTLYTSADGHAKKSCEETFETFVGKMSSLSTGKVGGQTYLCFYGYNNYGGGYDSISHYFKIEDGAFSQADDLFEAEEYNMETDTIKHTYTASGKEITESEFNAIEQKYTNGKRIFGLDFGYFYIEDRGLLPSPKIEVNGSVVKLSADPHISDGTLMVPLRDVLEAMGVAVYANPDASAILASTKSDTLVITYKDFSDWSFEGINSDYYGRDKTYQYSMNGEKFQKSAIEFTDGKAFVPLQTIVPLFGATVEWDGKAGAMQITSNIPDSSRMSQDELKQIANFDLDQAQRIAVEKGYKGPWDGAPIPSSQTIEFYDAKVLAFKNGKAVWTLYTGNETEYIRDETGRLVGESIEMYRIDVASDGTVTEYPNDKAHTGAGQI